MTKRIILLLAIKLLCLDYSVVGLNVSACEDVFNNVTWPLPIAHANDAGLVRLCQNPYGTNRSYFVSLFSTERRCPIYSANKVTLPAAGVKYLKEPNKTSKYWERVANSLCGESAPSGPILSDLKKNKNENCKKWQAVDEDYKNNSESLTRGHLEPRNTNNYDNERQLTTYTLTNACPQYMKFNNEEWSTIECVTRNLIITLSPNKGVFVITGVEGDVKDENNNPMKLNKRVAVPEKFWKAVCYPGTNSSDQPWAFFVEGKNQNEKKPDFKTIAEKFQPLNDTIQKIFSNDQLPFSLACMNAKVPEITEKLKNC